MKTSPTNEEVVEAVERLGSMRAAAREFGLDESSVRRRYHRTQARPEAPPVFEAEALPEADEPIEEFVARRAQAFARKRRAEDARKLIGVRVNIEGPFGILHMGDPHLDDDGCDLDTLMLHMRIARETPGLLAGNVGDFRNNWIGRLARLYAHQGTTAHDGKRLVEWFIREVPWLYLISGNHDVWSGVDSPVDWLARQVGAVHDAHGVRLALRPPKGREIRVNTRHDHSGHSQWNPAHGPMKTAMMGWRDHILLSGHRHVFGMGVTKDPMTGLWSHAIRVGTYKVYDEYAKSNGFPEHNLPAVVTVINPCAEREEGVVEVIKDVEAAADYLTFLRRRFSA